MGKPLLIVLTILLTSFSAHAFCFQEAGQRYEVSPWLLWAIAKTESGLNSDARNHNSNGSVDIGLMQINSIWAEQLSATWSRLDDPCANVMVGAWVLRQCVQDYGYTWQAVGCYHSRTPARRDAYAARIAAILANERKRASR